jgi:hypothetical protein
LYSQNPKPFGYYVSLSSFNLNKLKGPTILRVSIMSLSVLSYGMLPIKMQEGFLAVS